jgi:hypothetical protein
MLLYTDKISGSSFRPDHEFSPRFLAPVLWESGCGTARSDLVGDGKFLDGVGLLG